MHRTLTELANHYGTDKGTVGPEPTWPVNNYTDIYEAYLGHIHTAPLRILEIGLGVKGDKWDSRIVQGRNSGGASLKMWYDYFPNAEIFGVDINECDYLNNDRIKTFVVDQGSVSDLTEFARAVGRDGFDVIIDDGSHRPDHQQITLSTLFPFVKNMGLYFIEDLMANGLGDGKRGRMASDDVVNTRKMLKHFISTGDFLRPNSLREAESLKASFANICFHVPKRTIEFGFQLKRGQWLKGRTVFLKDEELICAIRKT